MVAYRVFFNLDRNGREYIPHLYETASQSKGYSYIKVRRSVTGTGWIRDGFTQFEKNQF